MGRLCFCNDTATTEIYTLSLHDALPIFSCTVEISHMTFEQPSIFFLKTLSGDGISRYNPVIDALLLPTQDLHRSEEHTSELQSRLYLECRLLLEKKKICSKLYHLHSPNL